MIYLLDELAARDLAAARSAASHSHLALRSDTTVAVGPADISTRAGAVLEVRVVGILTERPDPFAAYFGGGNTTYASIVRSLDVAAADPGVREVVFDVNSPGGTVDGLFEALDAIERFRAKSGKRTRTVGAKALSAAYAIAAAAGPITARTPASMFGSIGTAIDFTVWDGMRTVSVTNTDSPHKRPDPMTDGGRAELVRLLDSINDLFVGAIARGRGANSDHVAKNYGRGSSFIARDAKRLGMIDAIASSASTSTATPRASASAPAADLGDMVAAMLAGEWDDDGSHHATSSGSSAGDLGDRVAAMLAGEWDAASAAPRSDRTGRGTHLVRGNKDFGDIINADLMGED